jgi:hypothetical protein
MNNNKKKRYVESSTPRKKPRLEINHFPFMQLVNDCQQVILDYIPLAQLFQYRTVNNELNMIIINNLKEKKQVDLFRIPDYVFQLYVHHVESIIYSECNWISSYTLDSVTHVIVDDIRKLAEEHVSHFPNVTRITCVHFYPLELSQQKILLKNFPRLVNIDAIICGFKSNSFQNIAVTRMFCRLNQRAIFEMRRMHFGDLNILNSVLIDQRNIDSSVGRYLVELCCHRLKSSDQDIIMYEWTYLQLLKFTEIDKIVIQLIDKIHRSQLETFLSRLIYSVIKYKCSNQMKNNLSTVYSYCIDRLPRLLVLKGIDGEFLIRKLVQGNYLTADAASNIVLKHYQYYGYMIPDM